MNWRAFGLLLSIVLWPLAALAAGEGPIEQSLENLQHRVFTRAPEDLMWSVGTSIGALLGLALHITFSWGEWRKVSGDKMGLWPYIYEDTPGFVTAVIFAVIAYFGLPVLGTIPAVQNFFGFTLGMNFLSATAASYIASSLGYKLRSWFIRKSE
jgi:hypothetical protein